MERHGYKAGLIKALRLIGGGVCVLLGLYFSAVGVACQHAIAYMFWGIRLCPRSRSSAFSLRGFA